MSRSRSGLRIVMICQAVDRDDPVLATAVRWLEALGSRSSVERVTALALRAGRHDLPAERTEVRSFGRGSRPATLAAFYRELARAMRPRPDLFFIYQGGAYPLLLLPIRLAGRIPVVQWKAHPVIDRAMAFYARYCDDLIFTSSPAAFPLDIDKVKVVGNGVDTRQFAIGDLDRDRDLVALGRVMPSKRIGQMARAVAHANRVYGTAYRLDFYGPVLDGSEDYAAGVEGLIAELGAGEWVRLRGPVVHEQLPALLNRYRASLNLSDTALDRAALEAMACGVPVLSSNVVFREAIPAELRETLTVDHRSTEAQAAAIHALLSRPERELAELGRRVREFVVAEHSVERLFDRILAEVAALRP